MDWKLLATTFVALFLAELGDKTQLAAIGLTAKTGKPLIIFAGAASALVLITLLAVIFGEAISRVIPINYLQKGAAVLFILIGILMLAGKL